MLPNRQADEALTDLPVGKDKDTGKVQIISLVYGKYTIHHLVSTLCIIQSTLTDILYFFQNFDLVWGSFGYGITRHGVECFRNTLRQDLGAFLFLQRGRSVVKPVDKVCTLFENNIYGYNT